MQDVSIEQPLKSADAIFDSSLRIRRLNALRSQLHLSETSLSLLDEGSVHSPTIGIEIEMTWDQALTDLRERWLGSADRPKDYEKSSPTYQQFSKLYHKNHHRLLPQLNLVSKVIPRVGFDAYWEFSFLPTRDIRVATAELHTLYDAGILAEGIPYATHMTIASLPSMIDAQLIAYLLEQAGGSTQERIETAITSKKGSWAQKGQGGVRKRYAHELIGADTVAYEIRTLVCSSTEQTGSIIQLGQQLGRRAIINPEEWVATKQSVFERLKAQDLPLTEWGSPKTHSDLWRKYGKQLLASAQ